MGSTQNAAPHKLQIRSVHFCALSMCSYRHSTLRVNVSTAISWDILHSNALTRLSRALKIAPSMATARQPGLTPRRAACPVVRSPNTARSRPAVPARLRALSFTALFSYSYSSERGINSNYLQILAVNSNFKKKSIQPWWEWNPQTMASESGALPPYRRS